MLSPLDDADASTTAAALAFLDEWLSSPAQEPSQQALFAQEDELGELLAAQASDVSALGYATVARPQCDGPTAADALQVPSLTAGDSRSNVANGSPPRGSAAALDAPPASSGRPAARAKKPRTYNPNRAREEQRRELLQLREQVPRLEQALAHLKRRARKRRAASSSSNPPPPGGNWRQLAAVRREQRELADNENAQLRTIVRRQLEIARKLQQILQTRHRLQSVMEILEVRAGRSDTAIFERLLGGVARSFLEVDAVFEAFGVPEHHAVLGLGGSMPFEITVRRVNAANRSTAEGQSTFWRYSVQTMDNMPWRAYCRAGKGGVGSSEDMVVERCGMKLYASGGDWGTPARGAHVCQFMKKSKESGRIVMAWGSFADGSGDAGVTSDAQRFQEIAADGAGVFPAPDSDLGMPQRMLVEVVADALEPTSARAVQSARQCPAGAHTHGESLEVTASKLMPFDVQATGDAAWRYFAHSFEHANYRFYYKKDASNLNVADNTIVEGFRLELHTSGRRALFRVHQVLRKYELPGGRVVLVWRAAMEPFEFAGRAVRGLCYHERGYVEIRGAAASPLSPACTLVQTCYIITPEFCGPPSLDPAAAQQLTDVVLSSTAANISASYQMIESALVDAAVRSLRDKL